MLDLGVWGVALKMARLKVIYQQPCNLNLAPSHLKCQLLAEVPLSFLASSNVLKLSINIQKIFLNCWNWRDCSVFKELAMQA